MTFRSETNNHLTNIRFATGTEEAETRLTRNFRFGLIFRAVAHFVEKLLQTYKL